MRLYPLEVVECRDDPCVYSKGHHAPGDFLRAVERDCLVEIGPIEHLWWRKTPSDGGMVMLDAKPNSPGAFPVTAADILRHRHPPEALEPSRSELAAMSRVDVVVFEKRTGKR